MDKHVIATELDRLAIQQLAKLKTLNSKWRDAARLRKAATWWRAVRRSISESPWRSKLFPQLFDMLLTNRFYQLLQCVRTFAKPDERFFGDLEMLGITGFHIGLVDDVEPGSIALPILWPDLCKPLITTFGKCLQVVEVVRGWAVVRQCQQHS